MSLNTSLPAFLDPLLKDNQPEEDFEEEQTPTSKKKKNAEPKITQQRNYSNTEDIQLCELWLDAFAHIACYKILVNTPKWNEYITNLQNKSASQKRKRQDTTTTIADLSEPPSNALSTTESSTGQMERPSGQKKSKNDQQQTDAWQQALAKSQKEMVEQTQLQNKLLSSQTKAMNSIAEDSRSMVEDSFMSKDYSHMDERTQRSVAATDVTSVYQTDVTLAGPTDTLCLCSNVSVGPADIKSVWATDVTSVASGRRYRGGL
ncbi:hypothetical protein PCANC_02668 [Puccinia coronata f. sp. avenae]|uniref:No apical meristem-associated C-terminal domain-containing protein n=1 Tax=Puccinia coronata f. sp. avenae TaxID=200324 RepID=A0A2N5W5K0_9BASI|nr:hypothetical protein PCANC_02668 [Puccinia coronata f. sp. avenae]